MARGFSGRVVLEIDPAIKDSLYIALAKKKMTLKDWFLVQCNDFINSSGQQTDDFGQFAAERTAPYGGTGQ
jgi:hypothetical protein